MPIHGSGFNRSRFRNRDYATQVTGGGGESEKVETPAFVSRVEEWACPALRALASS
jgi:hypothetical protein